MDSASATYTMPIATIDADDGSYTCVAKIDTVVSEASAANVVSCKSVLSLTILFCYLFETIILKFHMRTLYLRNTNIGRDCVCHCYSILHELEYRPDDMKLF